MAAEELAFQYLIVGVLLSITTYWLHGYLQNSDELKDSFMTLAMQLPASVPNPLVYTRILYCFTTKPATTFRVVKRFWLNHGFKLVLMSITLMYTGNVWSETLSDDPFTIVGVSPSASAKDIRRACRNGSLKLHPDKHPGEEEKIRPQFEKHTRSCKLLNDPKAKSKYIKYGVWPKKEQKDGEVAGATGGFTASTILQAGGGSYLLTFLVYFLMAVGIPSLVLENIGSVVYDDETRLDNAITECKSLSDDMLSLYGSAKMSSLFIDIADLYLITAQAETKDAKERIKEFNPKMAKNFESLLGHHMERYAMWQAGVKKDDSAAGKKLEKVEAKIEEARGALDKRRGSSK